MCRKGSQQSRELIHETALIRRGILPPFRHNSLQNILWRFRRQNAAKRQQDTRLARDFICISTLASSVKRSRVAKRHCYEAAFIQRFKTKHQCAFSYDGSAQRAQLPRPRRESYIVNFERPSLVTRCGPCKLRNETRDEFFPFLLPSQSEGACTASSWGWRFGNDAPLEGRGKLAGALCFFLPG